jgi:hypothetical protein
MPIASHFHEMQEKIKPRFGEQQMSSLLLSVGEI